ncbi:MarP family serine protease [Agromyces larvae]|uniref:MarP family serine protease n=1 Tax=Agromyces larvae TaxID=2929802 RepID=A0ABY4BTH8_9MICO|nr:MarP family serine protease [Agromyces larvae]UOE42502.1 MarP family serine protease [Agromyces larvae]
MTWTLIVDALLVVLLVSAVVNGFRAGLLRTAGGLVGLLAGGIAAWFLMPLVVGWVPVPDLRVAAALTVGLLALAAGTAIGAVIGRALRRGARAVKLGWFDRILGAIAGLLVAALAATIVGTGVARMGVPVLSPALSSSFVLRGIDSLTPEPVDRFVAEVRTATLDGAVPWITEVLGGPTTSPAIPDVAVDGAAIAEASESVVRITGPAYRCGRDLVGSGFAVSPDHVVTNAHVVAGVTEPIVEAPGRLPVAGRVVAFDAANDLAVVYAPDLDATPLELAATPATGADAIVAGHPFGGPLTLEPARVLAAGPLTVEVDGVSSTRDVVTLAARVEHGNSGGPVLDLDGRVAGVVFAKSEQVANVGYAISPATLAPLAAEASTLTEAVSSGECAA